MKTRSSPYLHYLLRSALQLGLLVLFTASFLEAQAPGTGAIAGSISDPSGAVVAHARVSVISEETNSSRTVNATAEGVFRVPLLLPGNYSIVVEQAGFKQKIMHSVHVVVSETAVVDVKLEVGADTVKIEVSGASELAQTESAALGWVTDEKLIVELPLANRNFTQILALSPGVVVELPNAANLGKATQNVSANGARPTSNSFLFNGVDANNISENSFSGFDPETGIAVPAPDTIAEFKVQTGMYDASYGRGSGATVDLISKTGSNNLHGNVWEFFRNDALNANDYFLKQEHDPRPVLRQNQFGFEIGGPIRKDKTFFFASYQGMLQTNGQAQGALQTALLPPLTNDRSAEALGALFGGQSGAAGGAAVASDGSNINPVALAILNFKFSNGSYAIPNPQSITSSGVGQSSFSIPAHFREDQFTVNLDHKISDANQLSGRFFYSRDPQHLSFSPFGGTVPGWGLAETERNDMFVLSDTQVFTPDLINVARFGFMRFNGLSRGDEPISAANVGMATPSGLPEIPGIAVNNSFTIGPAGEPFYFEITNSFIWQDTVSLTEGRNSIQMGAEAKRDQLDVNVPYVSDGFLFFLSFPDFLLGQSGTQNGSGISNIFSSTGAAGDFLKDERYSDLAGFIQDNIRVSPRLTLNTGLRYEYFGAPNEIDGHLPNFDPTIAAHDIPASGSTFSGFVLPANYTGPLPAGYAKSQNTGMWSPDYKDFSPRFGFALRLLNSPTLVLRGGYGIYYQRLSAELAQQVVGAPPFSLTQALQGSLNSAATFQQPYNPALPPNSSFPIFLPRTADSNLTVPSISHSITSPYNQEYDLNLQYEFAKDFLWQVGYVGTKGTHLTGCVEFNQALIATPQNPVNGQTTTTVENLGLRLPFQGIGSGASYNCKTTFDSSYNSFQTNVVKRLSNGLNFQASYTFSKNLDYTSGTGGLPQLDLDFISNDQSNPRQARGLDNSDRRHRFVLSFVYAPPKLTIGSRLVRSVFSQWQFSGEAVLQSGLPITVTDSSAGTVYGNLTGFSRAECTGANPASSGSITSRLKDYFNNAAFAPPPVIGDGTGFGDCGVGLLRGPGQMDLDLGIQRNFAVTERSTLQFRTEFFNLTNTPNFAQPNNDFAGGNNPSFGAITATSSNPRIIQFALKYNF
jgi:Carboxypeptidase regulatory-like domain/TonB-dependent Receptor Plug Domain/TonB dependent receptor